ncbi:lysophospholipid transporter LplT [Candidatus Kinetoplastibacterium desouzaii TCC079E]|uniref:Lysophospholipid transporter LplT n=1 Tax=Candidatus Kinetoplastidibacterium desouzai TCC079E TaxID=1208919 RepID=M1LUQ2_9PROT|nr:lysophospholipid transporter LplT [Candidatus Kinetoplastibacterium desouzaii]AGF47034.1 lysophospholipid transporter LplT [Candidatus Kinetoplastibacterium desouzaii TCC079E]
MKKGFYIIMAAQTFSSLADNALFISAIALIIELDGPYWMIPIMKWSFALSYVVLAPFVGLLADKFPKGHVMFFANCIKMIGCFMIILHQCFSSNKTIQTYLIGLSYGLIGIGASIYSPAKYGIVTEILPARMLIKGNSWIEGLTVVSIILGTCLGGFLITPLASNFLINHTFISSLTRSHANAAIFVILFIYLISAAFNLAIRKTNINYNIKNNSIFSILNNFYKNLSIMYNDKIGRISIAITTIFWGVSASLQLIVIEWGQKHLGYSIDQTSILIGLVAIGTVIGSIIVAKYVRLAQALSILPVGIIMGLLIFMMPIVNSKTSTYLLLISTGILAGFFVVPMNALLQHRGYKLLSAGNSIAVQNFNEQLSILLMISLYAILVWLNIKINTIIIIYGIVVTTLMSFFFYLTSINKKSYDKLLQKTINEE